MAEGGRPVRDHGNLDLFVLFGDSITQMSFSQDVGFAFGAALSDAYVRKLDIINRGLSGYNTTQALRSLPYCIPEPAIANVRFLTIFFGANDARIAGSPGGPSQTVALDEFRSNIRQMVTSKTVQTHKDIRIILVTTPPVDERMTLRSDKEMDPNSGHTPRRTATNAAIYANAVREMGAELGVAVLDIWKAMLSKTGHTEGSKPLPGSLDAPTNPTLESFFTDGLHFSGHGYRLLFNELMSLIERTWPDQMPAKLPMILPAWDHDTAWREKEDEIGGAGQNDGTFVGYGTFDGWIQSARNIHKESRAGL